MSIRFLKAQDVIQKTAMCKSGLYARAKMANSHAQSKWARGPASGQSMK